MSNNSAEIQNGMNQINTLIKNSISANKLERQQGKYLNDEIRNFTNQTLKRANHNNILVIAIVSLDGMRLDDATTSTLINYI